MDKSSSGEVLFTVSGADATLVSSVGIEKYKLTEPEHLEKWVTKYPETLGSGVMILASQYDKWVSIDGIESKDRLDLLGLDKEGRLVVAELKRGKAPETIELQAIKYAAMTSRFTLDQLADLHVDFLYRTEEKKLSNAEVQDKLQSHASEVELTPDLFLSPRIVLLAESFRESTLTSAIWLSEQGVDLTLRRYQAYETAGKEIIVSVSQIYPLPDVGRWMIGPGRGAEKDSKVLEVLPVRPWTVENFMDLIKLNFTVPIKVLAVCSQRPDKWIGSSTIFKNFSIEPPNIRGRLAGFGLSVRTRFDRRNPPWDSTWAHGGEYQAYYRVGRETADNWNAAYSQLVDENVVEDPESNQ